MNTIRKTINMALESEDSLAEWGSQAVKKIQKSLREKITE